MTPLFRKLQLGRHALIHVLGAPASFEPQLALLEGVTVRRAVRGWAAFALAFVTTQAELEAASTALASACAGDAVLWMVFPKSSSKRHRCGFDRDGGWTVLGAAGFEPVRMVAIDEDWSALRFRRVEHIRSMVRQPARAISAAGRQKASANDAG